MNNIMEYCYHVPEEVAEIDGIHYYCSDKNGVSDFNGEVVFNFTGRPNIPVLDIPELSKHVDNAYKEIVVAWPDFGTPRVKSTFWLALHNYVVSMGWKNVCIHCEGGHGRTGTAIAAILISVAAWSVPDTIEYIRSSFCEKLVETEEQMDYLCNLDEVLNGRKTPVTRLPIPSMILVAQQAQDEKDQREKKMLTKAVGLSYNVSDEDNDK